MADRQAERTAHGKALLLCVVCCALSGCESLWNKTPENTTPYAKLGPPALPGKSPSQRISQFVFYSDTPIKASAPLFQELSDLRETIYRDLKLPPSNNVVQVYLFDDQEKYEKFMRFRYPELPRRRAFFIAQPRAAGGTDELLVFTYWGEHIRQDLRHEATHALLHSVLREVPLWLDEGLAEYYELPADKNGLNTQHLDAMRANALRPNLATLESLDEVQQMGRVQYQEAWAWVHLMLRSSPEAKQVLLTYLQQLRGPDRAGPLAPKLKTVLPAPEQALVQHLARFDTSVPTVPATGPMGPTGPPTGPMIRPVAERR